MASWPKGRLEVPFPYFAEVMTGFEYCAAVGMLYEGLENDALKCIQSIRERHDGAKRNPFSEPECGHHYARSMASWATIIAMSGFNYSGIEKSMKVTDRPGRYFWSNGYSWGNFEVSSNDITIEVLSGSLSLEKITVGAGKEIRLKKFSIKKGDKRTINI